MNLFTRISATVTGTLDAAVSQVENHDAVVAVALKDTRAAVAKARVRLEQVRKDGHTMRTRLQELQRKQQLWTDRARSIAQQDEHKALECIARRNQCRDQLNQLTEALLRHDELEQKMAVNVDRMEQRMRELSHQQ